VEKHFRETHLPNIIRPVETVHLSGPASRNLRPPGLARLVRSAWEQQRRFPIQVATSLSQQFASRGLQFFKVNRTLTHVAVARPRYLDLEATTVSEGVRRIVEYINAHPKCTRRDLVSALAPRPAEAAPVAAVAEGPAPAAVVPAEPTAEETQVIADLHWLVHQGHVIEFAHGALETAKKPLPKPAKPEPAAASPAVAAPSEVPSATQPPEAPPAVAASGAEATQVPAVASESELGTEPMESLAAAPPESPPLPADGAAATVGAPPVTEAPSPEQPARPAAPGTTA
jgi:hypothetical protein